MTEPTRHEAAREAALAARVEPPFTNTSLQQPAYRAGWGNGWDAARAAYGAARGGEAEGPSQQLYEATEFLDSFVTEWLTELGADESQLEGVRKRVEFYRLALFQHPEPRQAEGVGRGCEECNGTGVAPDGENECEACYEEPRQDQPVDRASGEELPPRPETCPTCGASDAEENLVCSNGWHVVEHPKTGKRASCIICGSTEELPSGDCAQCERNAAIDRGDDPACLIPRDPVQDGGERERVAEILREFAWEVRNLPDPLDHQPAINEILAARHPHQDVERDRDQKREQLDRQQRRAETAEAAVERLRERVSSAEDSLAYIAAHGDKASVVAAQRGLDRLAPSPDTPTQLGSEESAPNTTAGKLGLASPDDRGGERDDG